MKMNPSVLIPPFLVFFIVNASQVGVGILSFTREIVEVSDYQAWIAVIGAAVLFHMIIWMMYFILNHKHNDVVAINNESFGTVFGFVMTVILFLHFIISGTIIVLTYVYVVQIWMFPELPTWVLSLAIFLVIYYGVLKGFRVIVGLCFLSLVIPSFLLLTSVYLIEYSTIRSLFPLFDTTVSAQLKAVQQMFYSFYGPEILLICYPFIHEARKSQKFAQLGNSVTTLLYLFVAIFSFAFFAENDLKKIMFPLLTGWKVIHLPFIERFEYLGIAIWMIVVIPNIALYMWGASRMLKRQFNVSQRKVLPLVITICFLLTIFFQMGSQIEQFTLFARGYSKYIIFAYIPLLFLIVAIKRRKKR